MLMGVEPRLTVAVPAVMVSAYMQGGCICENAPNLRVDTFNTEIAALMAPRPLLLISATGDWTSHNPTEEYPDIRSIYELYGAADRTACVQIDAPHNYNLASREAMYAFFAQWLRGVTEEPKEQPLEPEKNDDLLVFANRDLPQDAWTEAELVEGLMQASEAQLQAAWPTDRKALKAFREVYGSSLAHALNLLPEERLATQATEQTVVTTDPWYIETFTLAGADADLRVPATLVAPAEAKAKRPTVVIVSDAARRELLTDGGHGPGPLVEALLAAGWQALLIDPFLVGDNQLSADSDRRPDDKFFDTYNRTDLALRVQDVVVALLHARERSGGARLGLIGRGEAGLWALLASAADVEVSVVAADMAQLDLGSDDELMHRAWTPCLRRAGDFRTAGALWAPGRLLLHNARAAADLDPVQEAYHAAGAAKKLTVSEPPATDPAVAAWLAE
jgi:hypothetical protein